MHTCAIVLSVFGAVIFPILAAPPSTAASELPLPPLRIGTAQRADVDWGSVAKAYSGQQIALSADVENTNPFPVSISVRSGCGCLTVSLDRSALAAGGKARLSLLFSSAEMARSVTTPRPFDFALRVAGQQGADTVVFVKGHVLVEKSVDAPRMLGFGRQRSGEPNMPSREILFTNFTGHPADVSFGPCSTAAFGAAVPADIHVPPGTTRGARVGIQKDWKGAPVVGKVPYTVRVGDATWTGAVEVSVHPLLSFRVEPSVLYFSTNLSASERLDILDANGAPVPFGELQISAPGGIEIKEVKPGRIVATIRSATQIMQANSAPALLVRRNDGATVSVPVLIVEGITPPLQSNAPPR